MGNDIKNGNKIIKPVFLAGPGRSGTTLTLSLMSLHPDVCWFSAWTHKFPRYPQLALLSRVNDLEPLEMATRGLRKWPRPAEAHDIWDLCFPGFVKPECDWTEEHVNPSGAAKLKSLIETHLRWHSKKRFLTKYTGLPRFRFLKAIFPDACLIYMDRDPRAVVFSYMKQKWGFKDDHQAFATMSMTQRLDLYTRRYLEIYQAKRQFDVAKEYIQLFYEQLVQDPLGVIRSVCERVELPFERDFARRIESWVISSETNQMWRQTLTSDEQLYLSKLLEQPLLEMGYKV